MGIAQGDHRAIRAWTVQTCNDLLYDGKNMAPPQRE